MRRWREALKRVPVLSLALRTLRNKLERYRLKAKTPEEVYTEIYRKNAWGGKESVSGTGSDDDQTKTIAEELPSLAEDLHAHTILDIPCGDFHWMQHVDLVGVDYIGADIVKDLILVNTRRYARSGIRFQQLNLIEDDLPKVDLVLCRDCLVHFSFEHVFSALQNIIKSQSRHILTTTFTDREDNIDIMTGQWRTLNLERAPFMFPKPLKLIYEGCTENGGAFEDKALGLWRIADIGGFSRGRETS